MSTTYITILTKNNIFSFLGLVRAEMIDSESEARTITAVIKHDPREGEPVMKQFDTGREAVKDYQEAVDTSVERGWSIVYRGTPMIG